MRNNLKDGNDQRKGTVFRNIQNKGKTLGKMMTSYLSHSISPLGSGNIISSHKRMWKCPSYASLVN